MREDPLHLTTPCYLSVNACLRHGDSYIANDLQYGNPINRRLRQRLCAATAVLSLAMWLLMTAAEVCAPLHEWLHGGSIPDDDDCAVVALAHGKVETVVCDAPAAAPATWIEIPLLDEFSVFQPVMELLPNGRAPPALPAVS